MGGRQRRGRKISPATPVATPVSILLADVPAALLPGAEQALHDLSSVRIAATLDPEQSTIGGEMEVTWRNPVPEPAGEVWFRLFPNASYYGEGRMTVSDVTVDGAMVTPELALDDTALRVPLPAPVAAGGTAQITMQFVATVPEDSTGSYGIFTHDTQAGLWVLADWHPLLAVREPDGWLGPAARDVVRGSHLRARRLIRRHADGAGEPAPGVVRNDG